MFNSIGHPLFFFPLSSYHLLLCCLFHFSLFIHLFYFTSFFLFFLSLWHQLHLLSLSSFTIPHRASHFLFLTNFPANFISSYVNLAFCLYYLIVFRDNHTSHFFSFYFLTFRSRVPAFTFWPVAASNQSSLIRWSPNNLSFFHNLIAFPDSFEFCFVSLLNRSLWCLHSSLCNCFLSYNNNIFLSLFKWHRRQLRI